MVLGNHEYIQYITTGTGASSVVWKPKFYLVSFSIEVIYETKQLLAVLTPDDNF
jgi:hypothetical protein